MSLPFLAPLFGAGAAGGAAAGGAAAAAGGAAAGAAAGAGIGSTLLTIGGSVLAGAAEGWLAGKEEKEEQRRIDAEQARRTNSLRGLGDSVRYWENDKPQNTAETVSERIASAPALGSKTQQVGQKYIERAERNRTQGPRYKFDRKSGQIKYG